MLIRVTGTLVIVAGAVFAIVRFFGESATFGTSDIVTYAEAALSLVLTSVAVAVGWRFASRLVMSV